MITYIVSRLGEASTWRGLIMLCTAIGIQVSPDQAAAIVSLGMAIAGAIGVFTPDAKK
jgi:hypothetical protein